MMTTKPVMQKLITIGVAKKEYNYVSFWAPADVVKEFEQFGKLTNWPSQPERYRLSVDGRFDFDEIVAYIENYC